MEAIDSQAILNAGLFFLRIGGIIFALPLFGDDTVPIRVRLMLSISLAIGLYPIMPAEWGTPLDQDTILIAFVVLKEIFIGLTLGYVAKLMFEGIILAANTVGYQMGFGTANVFMADASSPMNGFTAFHRIIALLIFLTLNLHHTLLMSIVDSFKYIPAGGAILQTDLSTLVINLTASIFSVAAQLSAPIIVALLFTMAALGLIARTVPQMNVFTMSFPLSFFIGLAIYAASTPYTYQWLVNHYYKSTQTVFEALSYMIPN